MGGEGENFAISLLQDTTQKSLQDTQKERKTLSCSHSGVTAELEMSRQICDLPSKKGSQRKHMTDNQYASPSVC